MVTLKKRKDAITDQLESMTTRANSMEAFFTRVIFKMYQDKQRKRWMSEGESEGSKWPGLDRAYRLSKPYRFADYPGSGRKMMIATNTLFAAVVEKPNKKATNQSITITPSNPTNPENDQSVQDYAKHANKERPFFKFSKESVKEMRDRVSAYIKSGKVTF